MAQYIKQADIFGRVGSGIGAGLAEQIPKEIERGRLASGLKALEKEGAELTPQQYFTRALSVPGLIERPQVVQSLADLARQQGQAQAFKDYAQGKEIPKTETFPAAPTLGKQIETQKTPSITQEKPLEKIQEGYIPPTQEEIDQIASQAFNENPAFFKNDPQLARQWSKDKAEQEEKINLAYQKKHSDLSELQKNVIEKLKNHAKNLGVEIPANVYSKIEDKAINAVKPKSQGGEGKTEQQAEKDYGEELDAISKDYKAIDTLGGWGITGRPAKESIGAIKSLQEKFEKRGDTENLAQKLIAKANLGPAFAYSLAQPVYKVPEINNELKQLKPTTGSFKPFRLPMSKEEIEKTSIQFNKKVAPLLKNNDKASPLAIAHNLNKLGYDGRGFLDYVIDHRDDLNLTEKQGRQLDIPLNNRPTINELWLSEWTGIE